MSKKFALILVVLMVVTLLMTACSTKSRDEAEKYMNALLKGEDQKALDLACESFKPQTEALLAYYKAQLIHAKSLDLKFDIGKGGNNKEIIVTGSYEYGDQVVALEQELTEKNKTLIILQMKEDGDNWCVTDKSEFGEELDALIEGTAAEPAEAPAAEPTAEPTKGS